MGTRSRTEFPVITKTAKIIKKMRPFDWPPEAACRDVRECKYKPLIHSTGFFRAKAKALIGMAQALVNDYGGRVPADLDALTTLPGVGRKTANVVLGHALGVPGLPVDRHVLRVSNRIGLARSDKPEVVEQQLCAALPASRWTLASDTLILHGRRICKPRPLCDSCSVQDDCDYFRTVIVRERRAADRKNARAPKRIRTARR